MVNLLYCVLDYGLMLGIGQRRSLATCSGNDKSVNALKLMALMGMGIKQNDTITVTVEGADEDTAAAEIEAFFKNNL